MDIQCAGCLKNTKLLDIKRIGKYYFCTTCQSYVSNKQKNK